MFSQDTSRRDFLLIVCASISWGTVGIANQALYTSGVTNALSLSFLRLAIATPLFFLACWTRLGRRLFRMKRRDLGVMMLMGSMIAFSQACYIAALASDGVGVSTLIAICVAPVIITVFTTCIARERLTLITLIVLVAALSGLAFLSACGYAGFILCGRLLTGRCHPLQISAVAFGTGTLVLLVCAASTRLVLVYSAWGWLILLYLGCVPTDLAYVLFDTDSYDG